MGLRLPATLSLGAEVGLVLCCCFVNCRVGVVQGDGLNNAEDDVGPCWEDGRHFGNVRTGEYVGFELGWSWFWGAGGTAGPTN